VTREEEYKRKADAFLKLAGDAADMQTRSSLIDRAAYWHNLAMEEREASAGRAHGDDGEADEARA